MVNNFQNVYSVGTQKPDFNYKYLYYYIYKLQINKCTNLLT